MEQKLSWALETCEVLKLKLHQTVNQEIPALKKQLLYVRDEQFTQKQSFSCLAEQIIQKQRALESAFQRKLAILTKENKELRARVVQHRRSLTELRLKDL